MSVIFTDTFTGTAGTDLTAHTPSGGSGGPWTKHPDYAASPGVIQIDTAGSALVVLSATSTNQAYYFPAGIAPSADYVAKWGVLCKSTALGQRIGYLGIRAGKTAADRSGYFLIFIGSASVADGSGTWTLYKASADGTLTAIGTPWADPGGGWVVGQTRQVWLKAVGAVVTATIDGTDRIAYTDPSPITAPGAVVYNGRNSGSQTAGYHASTLTVDDLGGTPPVNTVAPAITTDGTPQTGETVTCSTGTWSSSPTGYAYQWKRNGVAISGATTNAYQLQAADESTTVLCTVTATNAAGSAAADSNSITPGVPAPVNTAPPVLSGNAYPGAAVTGETLTCTTGTWTGSPTGYTRQWKRDGAAISGATAATYTVQAADQGHDLTCTVTATNAAGSNTATSAPLTGTAGLTAGSLTYREAAAGGLGGLPGATLTGQLFDDVTPSEARLGSVEYRLVFASNDHAVLPLEDAVAWITQASSSPDTEIDIAPALEAPGDAVEVLQNETTAPPPGVSFSRPASKAEGVALGDIPAGEAKGVWVRRTVNADAAPAASDVARVRFGGATSVG